MVPCSGGKDIRLCHIDTPLISACKVLTLTKLQYSLFEYFNNLHSPFDKLITSWESINYDPFPQTLRNYFQIMACPIFIC